MKSKANNRQIVINNGKLKYVDGVMPIPQENELLIKVSAIGVNRADVLQLEGKYGAKNDDSGNVPGLEVSGIEINTGKRLCALLSGNGYSQYVCVDKDHVFEVPDNLSMIEAASVPESLTTIAMALEHKGNIQSNDNVLIHGGSSGVGTFAIQYAKNLGCKVFTTVGKNQKIDVCKKLGANFCINYQDDFVAIAKENGGVDLMLDLLGGHYLACNMKSMNKYGRIINIATMAGNVAQINTASLLMKNITITGATLRSQSSKNKAQYIKIVVNKMLKLFVYGKIKPVISNVFSFYEADDALNILKKRVNIGKVILVAD